MDFLRKLAPLALVAAVSCADTAPSTTPPTSQFYYPTGLAVTKLADGRTVLVAVSSNFDLQYDPLEGGTIIVVDVAATIANATPTGPPDAQPYAPVVLGAARIGSFGGEVAIVNERTCPGWQATARAPMALVASRSLNLLYAVPFDAAGAPTCDGPTCERMPLDPTATDAYGMTLVCEGGSPGTAPTSASAFVTYLRTTASEGLVSRVSLLDAPPGSSLPGAVDPTVGPMDFLGPPTNSTAFDPGSPADPGDPGDPTATPPRPPRLPAPAVPPRLYVTSRFGVLDTMPLRWADLSNGGFSVGASLFIDPFVRGAEMRGIALSSQQATPPRLPRRAYVALRLFDDDLAASLGARPTADIGAALAVIDLDEKPTGGPTLAVLGAVPVSHGANEVRAIPRVDGQGAPLLVGGSPVPDLVAVASTDDGTVSLYDAATGAIAKVFAVEQSPDGVCDVGVPQPCFQGRPQMGKQPFGMAVEAPFARADVGRDDLVRLYVGSFDMSWVNVIEIDPRNPGSRFVKDASGNDVLLRWDRIGAQRPGSP